MKILTAMTVASCGLILASCAAKPIVMGDSTLQQKVVSFPKQGQQVHVVVGGIVHLKADYQNTYAYRLASPLSIGFMLGRVTVSNQERLSQASLDGEAVFCTSSKVYSDPITGPVKRACFLSAEKGKFNNLKVAPGEVWFNKELTPPVDYVGFELAYSTGGKPLKRELIFEGGQKESLLFTEKIYETSVETASRAKPLLAKVDAVPSKVTLDGAEITCSERDLI
jgi:hypothetical protein